MKRLLLTQSQVSVALSSVIVFAFTLALFLSGYVLQQRTVTGLQNTLKPRIPKAPSSLSVPVAEDTVKLQHSRFFQGNGKVAYARKAEALNVGASVDWKRLAHVQIARNHHDVCNAVMVLAELHKQKSPARRILLFPISWAGSKINTGKGEVSDPFMDSTLRLMRLAARRYGVELHPIAPITKRTTRLGEEEDVFSLASAFALNALDRVLFIEAPGMLLDAAPLDSVLAFTEKVPFATLQDNDESSELHPEDLMLFQPSGTMHTELVSRLLEIPAYNDTLLSTVFDRPLLLASDGSSNSALVRSIGSLHAVEDSFNKTEFLSNLAYLRFSDPKLPGPEYDVPWAQRLAARPKNNDADWTWTKMRGEFGLKRMEICGLDLETWLP
ncbi:glucose n-acetyltransferase 1 [Acrodontium crateriforme]|uniref:Glucose n-acetyltransferase 1 n=1 Tax=Acrodontium crateriforme TaxID=150365 RepID=A0AAQ3M8T7_9PEZI|nr:glucose n-acetyltransferase 1 [Acrodontium crateriforme]